MEDDVAADKQLLEISSSFISHCRKRLTTPAPRFQPVRSMSPGKPRTAPASEKGRAALTDSSSLVPSRGVFARARPLDSLLLPLRPASSSAAAAKEENVM